MTTTERPTPPAEIDVERHLCPCGAVPAANARAARAQADAADARTRTRRRVAPCRCAWGNHHVADAGHVRRGKADRHHARTHRGDTHR